MADVLKVLGQASLVDDTWTTIYTVPTAETSSLGIRTSFQTFISSIIVCNVHASTAFDYSIRVVPSADTPAVKHLIFNAVALAGETTDLITPGITLSEGDSIDVYALDAGSADYLASFSVFGVETV